MIQPIHQAYENLRHSARTWKIRNGGCGQPGQGAVPRGHGLWLGLRVLGGRLDREAEIEQGRGSQASSKLPSCLRISET